MIRVAISLATVLMMMACSTAPSPECVSLIGQSVQFNIPVERFWSVCLDVARGVIVSDVPKSLPEREKRRLIRLELGSDLHWSYGRNNHEYRSVVSRGDGGEVVSWPGWVPVAATSPVSFVFSDAWQMQQIGLSEPKVVPRFLESNVTALARGERGVWYVKGKALRLLGTTVEIDLDRMGTTLSALPGGWLLLFTKISEKAAGRGLTVRERDLTAVRQREELDEMIVVPASGRMTGASSGR